MTLSGAGSLTPAGAPKPATARPGLAEADARLLANLSGWADPPRPPGGRDGMGGGGGRRHDTRSLRRALRVHSELSVAPVKDTHAPEKAKRRASFVEPLLVRADVLNPYAAALARFSHAAGTTDRVRRQALKGRSTQVSRASHCVDSEGKLTNHQAAATRAAWKAGLTLKTRLDELEATLEEQLEHKAMTCGDEAPQPATVRSTSTAYQKVKSPLGRPKKATSFEEWLSPLIEEEKRRQAVLAHGRSVSVYGVAGEPEFVPEEEEVGADRYSIGEDGSVLTQGDFLTGAKIKRQSKSPGGEITF